MKINIDVEQKVQKKIELETPAYFKDGKTLSLITETQVINVSPSLLVVWEKGNLFYSSYLTEALKGEQSTKEEFEFAFNRLISNLNEVILEKELA